jgi:large conductance mechanosensitive channel
LELGEDKKLENEFRPIPHFSGHATASRERAQQCTSGAVSLEQGLASGTSGAILRPGRPPAVVTPHHQHNVRSFTMGFATEFKEFAMKGNVVDLAVGVIIGGAFGKIVDSIVADLIMPVVGKLFGGLDFSNYFIPLAGQTATNLADAKKAGAVFAYGSFLTVAVNFVILAFVIFVMIQQINRLKKAEPAATAAPAPEPVTPEDIVLLREIRDSLSKR